MFVVEHDHDDFLLINKAPGISFHKEGDFPGLVTLVREKLGISSLYPVHRLDKMTSGLLVFAKNSEAAREFGRQFSQGRAQKYYLALSDRLPKKKQGIIKGDMVRSRRGTWKLTRSMNNPAITRFLSFSLGEGLRLYLLKPLTGKTHQLRVALRSVGAPALGDDLYHPGIVSGGQPDRGYLHSFSLAFQLAGITYRFVCPPLQGKLFSDSRFLEALSRIQQPWTLFPVDKSQKINNE